ncbi:MAG: hypothetical protein H6Q89_1189 [Myxococcaceae bacterium]|nr:hypothetical protein [Myxococcaceae bacterium]
MVPALNWVKHPFALKIPVLVALGWICGCSRSLPAPVAPEAPAAAVAIAPPAPVEDDCTLQTELKPGIPGSPGHLLPSEINMNGASELAMLMRVMKADLEAARTALDNGEPIGPMHARHRKIRCSWPTALEDRNPTFEANAISYLLLVRAFDAKPAEPRAAYEGVVSGCLACHATSCPGPIQAIETLHLVKTR